MAYQAPTSYVIPITFAVAALGCWFQVLVAVDSCRIKNKLQIWIQCIINVCLSITLALQFSQAKEANDSLVEAYDMFNTPFTKNPDGFWRLAHPISILCIAISAVCSVGLCTTATRLHAEFSWSVYEHISSDALIKKRHDQYQVSSVSTHVPNLIYSLAVLLTRSKGLSSISQARTSLHYIVYYYLQFRQRSLSTTRVWSDIGYNSCPASPRCPGCLLREEGV